MSSHKRQRLHDNNDNISDHRPNKNSNVRGNDHWLAQVIPFLANTDVCDTVSLGRLAFLTCRTIRNSCCCSYDESLTTSTRKNPNVLNHNNNNNNEACIYFALCRAHWGMTHAAKLLSATQWTAKEYWDNMFPAKEEEYNAEEPDAIINTDSWVLGVWSAPRSLRYQPLEYTLTFDIRNRLEGDEGSRMIFFTLMGNEIPKSFWESGRVEWKFPHAIELPYPYEWHAKVTLAHLPTNRSAVLVETQSYVEFTMNGEERWEKQICIEETTTAPFGKHGYAGWLRHEMTKHLPQQQEETFDDTMWTNLDLDIVATHAEIQQLGSSSSQGDEDHDPPLSVGGLTLSYLPLDKDSASAHQNHQKQQQQSLTTTRITFAHVIEALSDIDSQHLDLSSQPLDGQPVPLQYSPDDYVLLVDIRRQGQLELPPDKHGEALVSLALTGDEIPRAFFETGDFFLELDDPIVVSRPWPPCWTAKICLLLKPKQRMVTLVKDWKACERYSFDYAEIRQGSFYWGKSTLPIETHGYGKRVQQELGVYVEEHHFRSWYDQHLGATVELGYQSRSREENDKREERDDFFTITDVRVFYRDMARRATSSVVETSITPLRFARLLEALPQFRDD